MSPGVKASDRRLGGFPSRHSDPQCHGRKPVGIYVANNPINRVDPTGEVWWAVVTAALGGGIGAFQGASGGYKAAGWKGAVVGGLVGAGAGAALGAINPTAAGAAGPRRSRLSAGSSVP